MLHIKKLNYGYLIKGFNSTSISFSEAGMDEDGNIGIEIDCDCDSSPVIHISFEELKKLYAYSIEVTNRKEL